MVAGRKGPATADPSLVAGDLTGKPGGLNRRKGAVAMVWMTVAGGDGDELSADLSPADQRAVRNAIAEGVLSGWQPTTDDITRLVAYAAGDISMADYLTHLTQTARRQRS